MCKKNRVLVKNEKELLPVETFSKTLTVPFDLGADVLESTIDALCNNDIIDKVPIVKTIVGITKIGIAIHQRNYLKKLLSFFQKINEHSNDPDVIRMRKRIEEDPHYLRKEAELALLVLERTLEAEKAQWLANAFYYYVKEEIDYIQYREMVMVIDGFWFSDIEALKPICYGNRKVVEKKHKAALNRIEGMGIIERKAFGLDFSSTNYDYYGLTQTGKIFVKVVQLMN